MAHPVLVLAAKEFRDGRRNRWVAAITLVLAALALGLSYFGAAASGTVGFTSLGTTIVSLSSLTIFLLPLIALLLSYDSVVGEAEQGTLLLLLTYPVSRSQILLGKFLGHSAIIAVSTLLGFGVSGLLIGLATGHWRDAELWQAFGFFILSATLLGCVFVALALLVSVLSREKSRAAGMALILWFWFVLIFDLLLLGLLVMSREGDGNGWIGALLLANPADVFRIANLAGFEAARSYSGLSYLMHGPLFSPAGLSVVLLLWILLPLALALWLFRRRLD